MYMFGHVKPNFSKVKKWKLNLSLKFLKVPFNSINLYFKENKNIL